MCPENFQNHSTIELSVKLVFYVTRFYATSGIRRFRLINVAPTRGHEGKLCLIGVFVVQPCSRPIPGLSRDLAAAVVLAVTVVVDSALAVATVLFMDMEVTKVCFLFDCCVLFSVFPMSLYPPYLTSMQQQRKLQAGGSGLQHRPGRASSAP